jgi:hypothetical protein
VAPARHQVGHRDPVGSDEISAPSSSTDPAFGLSIRTSARSSVDFPHAFGPTIAVNPLAGIATLRSRATTLPS